MSEKIEETIKLLTEEGRRTGYLTYGEVFGWFGLTGFAIAVVGVALATRAGR